MKRFLVLMFFVLVIATVSLFAQADGDYIVDPNVVWDIMEKGVIGGFGAIAAIELLKRLLHTAGWKSVVLSVVVSAVFTGIFLAVTTGFAFWEFIGYSTIVSLAANGIYLFPKGRTNPPIG